MRTTGKARVQVEVETTIVMVQEKVKAMMIATHNRSQVLVGVVVVISSIQHPYSCQLPNHQDHVIITAATTIIINTSTVVIHRMTLVSSSKMEY